MNIRHRFVVSGVVRLLLLFSFIWHVMMMTTPQISYDVLYTHSTAHTHIYDARGKEETE